MSAANGVEWVRESLRKHGLNVALRHLESSQSAYERGEWEAANGQQRTFLEAVYEGVARLVLGQDKKRGEARKAREREGILNTAEAALVKSYMDLAAGEGAHPGLSNEDDAVSRQLIGIGLARRALALIPNPTRVQDVFLRALDSRQHAAPPSDEDVRTRCPTCRTEQTLAEATLSRDGQQTVYHCRNGCQAIAILGEPEDRAWPGRGYRVGSYVIRNASDLIVAIPGAARPMLIPASPAGLMRIGPRDREIERPQ
ncbi:MAG TPA: hypothetical protein VGR13_00405 [Actinomycetota bacterium]|nr:hypothetical protein [Actinomycetota bacterium]